MKEIEQLNHTIIEFYEKLSSWEQSVVRDKGFTLPQVHIVEILGGTWCHAHERAGRQDWRYHRHLNCSG